MNYDLIELTIYFDENTSYFDGKESESMIVSIDSMAHQFVKDYVKVNGYKLTEKPLNNQ